MQVRSGSDELQNYLSDASNLGGGHAQSLFLPGSSGEVAKILRDANDKRITITISGARTGTVGGAIPFGGSIISLEKLNEIKYIDKETMTAVVESGVILGDLQKAVENVGLYYPPDPTEWSCQIGGTVSTNASGARSFKYGSTREFVRKLKVVLADGDELEIVRGDDVAVDSEYLQLKTTKGRTIGINIPTYQQPDVRKNVSGYHNSRPFDVIDLFIGSEGTLGVITEIELSLLPKPESFFTGVVFFEETKCLVEFVDAVRGISVKNQGLGDSFALNATLLEYFDDRALGFISHKFPDVPPGMAGAIFFEQETTNETEDDLIAQWNELLEKHEADVENSWFALDENDRARMREFRHALPVAVNERITKYQQKKVGTDMAVPGANFPGFLRFYKQILDASGIDYVIFGHIGDCHLHANMLPKDKAEATAARHVYGRCVAQAIMLGGVVSAEHGIGKLKRKYLAAAMGERHLNEMVAMKKALDPNSILGRGNIFDESYL